MEDLKEIKFRYFNKEGVPITTLKEAKAIRLSVYFDYDQDNHHVQIELNADRATIANSLIKLSRLIINYNQPLQPTIESSGNTKAVHSG